MEVRNSWLNIIIVLGCCSNFFCREHCRTQNTAGWKPQLVHSMKAHWVGDEDYACVSSL